MSAPEVEATIERLVRERGSHKSICPSEAARALAAPGEDWRRHMPAVRRAAIALARAGHVAILRKGRPVDPEAFKGVYRIGLPRGPAADQAADQGADQGAGNSAPVRPEK